MTATYKSAVFDNCIINAFAPAASTKQAAWPAHTQGGATPGVASVLITGSSGSPIAKTTNALYSDISTQVANGNGYATGGYDPTTSVAALTTSVCKFIATGTSSWTAATFSCATAVFDTIQTYATIATATNSLLCYNDLTAASGTSLSVVSGTLTLTWAAGGVMTITITGEA